MVERVTLEICKLNGESRYISYFHEEDNLFIKVGIGYEGAYPEQNIHAYACQNNPYYSSFLNYVEKLKIYSWPRAIPKDYVPGKYMIGCDTDSWSLVYKEKEKKRFCRIHGKGAYPQTEPYITLVRLLDAGSPEKWLQWLDE